MTSEPTELSAVIGDIYDAAIDPALWQRALGSICAFVGGHSAALFWHDSAAQRSEALHLFNEDPYYTKLYFEKYMPMNPVFPAATFLEAGRVCTTNDIIPQDELEKTRFYKEWVKPQGIVDGVAVNLEKGTTCSSLLNIRTNASYGMADADMRRRLSLLTPHILRAVSIGRLLDQSRAREKALATTLEHVEAAVLMVGSDGAIAFANEPAKAMLAEGAVIRAAGDVLRAVSHEADRALRAVFKSAQKGDASVGVRGVAVPLTASSQDRWFAHVLPLTSGTRLEAGLAYAASAAVFIRKTMPETSPLETVARLHNLTAGEARVLDAVLKVNGVKAIAEKLGLSQATVKTHLHNLFRKTGARRQSELVKLVAGLEP
ncbi:MAG: helix-turn-helix transcriptional regulator [Hyphomicrobiales bacterium]|nr:helix-turn-helix transcriptional regulator [Hyphomicrobiales bacterium]